MRRKLQVGLLAIALLGMARIGFSQAKIDLPSFFKNNIGLSDDEIASIRKGQAVSKVLPSRTPAEIFVFGAVYINVTPESYLRLSQDYKRLRALPGYIAIERISDPPQLSELQGFDLDAQDVQALKNCKPNDCPVQLGAGGIEEIHKIVDFNSPNAADQVNQYLQKSLLERLTAYQKQGNIILGEYNDKQHPTEVADQFKYILSYSKALPQFLPAFTNYLLTYPADPPPNVENTFYWDNVKFGLKPTLRVVHVVTMRGNGPGEPVYSIAEKQLYSSHYFETALDLAFCYSEKADPKQPGFYLLMAMGSEQAGLTGFKGSIIRKEAVSHTASSLKDSLNAIRQTLESGQSK